MPINWSTLATEHGVTGGNKGQVVKEFLAQHNVKPAPRRSKKRREGLSTNASTCKYRKTKPKKTNVQWRIFTWRGARVHKV